MTVADIEPDIRFNISDNSGDPKYQITELIDNICRVLDRIWKDRRIAFCHTEVLTSRPDYPIYDGDDLPVSDEWADAVVNGVSARMLRHNSADPATIKAATNFERLFEEALA